MLSIKLSQAIPTIVEAMLPRFSFNKVILAITLDLRDEDLDTNKSAATIMRFLFHRPSNFTKVLVHYEFNNFNKRDGRLSRDPVYYEKYSDHDSCWRSDGLTILSEHWKEVEKFFNKHPSEINSFYSFSIFDPIRYLELNELTLDRQDDGYTRGYNVSIKREIPLNEIHKYLEKKTVSEIE